MFNIISLISLVILGLLNAATLTSQDAPAKHLPESITIVVGVPAGGGTGDLAESFAPALSEQLGVPVEVLYRPGQNGRLALQTVRDGARDGSMLFFAADGDIASNYNPKSTSTCGIDGLQSLGMVSISTSWLLATSKHKETIPTIHALIKAAESQPGKLRLGTVLPLSSQTSAALMLQKHANDSFELKIYSGGRKLKKALRTNEVDCGFLGFPVAQNDVQHGTVYPLCTVAQVHQLSAQEGSVNLIIRLSPRMACRLWTSGLYQLFPISA